jgi:1-acyl-sn-glycerol-3-phosphate acyltransferase
MLKEFLQQSWHRIARAICTLSICVSYRMRVFGRENVPKSGPVLLLSNHQSFLDPIFAQSTVWRNFYFIARQSLFEAKFLGPLITSLNTVPINRGQADIAAMKTVIELLKDNKPVCLFPEATRTDDGKIAQIKPGFGLLSRRGKAMVVPVVIEGAFECWPRHRKFPKLGRVAVIYGKPFTPEDVKRIGDRDFAQLLTERLRQMQNQLREKMGKPPLDYTQEPESSIDEPTDTENLTQDI